MPVRALIITPLIYIRITNSVERNSFEIENIYIRVHISCSDIGYFFFNISIHLSRFITLIPNKRGREDFSKISFLSL